MVTIRMRTMVMLTMIPFVESWCTSSSPISSSVLGLASRHRRHPQPQPLNPPQRRSTLRGVANIYSKRPIIMTRRQVKRVDEDDDDVKGRKKQDANEESSAYNMLSSVGNVFSFSKSSSEDKTAAGKDDKKKDSPSSSKGKAAAGKDDKKKDIAPSWWPQLGRTSQAKISPPPSADRGKEGIRRDKKVASTKQEAKTAKDRNGGDDDNIKFFFMKQQQDGAKADRQNKKVASYSKLKAKTVKDRNGGDDDNNKFSKFLPPMMQQQGGSEADRRNKKVSSYSKLKAKTVKDRGVDDDIKKFPKFLPMIAMMQKQGGSEADRRNSTSNETSYLANRFQSLLNTTMPWNQKPQQVSASSNKTENPVSVFLKFFGNAATDSTQQLKNKTGQDWGSYPSAAQKFLADAASGGMKRFTKSSSSLEWLPVFPKTRISPGEVVPATIAGIDVLVVASSDGRKLYCLANSCPHLGTPLETGMLERRPIDTSSNMQPSPLSTKRTSASTSTDTSDKSSSLLSELEVMRLLQQDGCEDCIVCPLHHTAFALESGQVRGEWCPYPPVIGKIMGTVNAANPAAVFDIRYKGKNVEVLLNTPIDGAQKESNDRKW